MAHSALPFCRNLLTVTGPDQDLTALLSDDPNSPRLHKQLFWRDCLPLLPPSLRETNGAFLWQRKDWDRHQDMQSLTLRREAGRLYVECISVRVPPTLPLWPLSAAFPGLRFEFLYEDMNVRGRVLLCGGRRLNDEESEWQGSQ